MDYCSECLFFSDGGGCRNSKSKRREVGYFQKACNEGKPAETVPSVLVPVKQEEIVKEDMKKEESGSYTEKGTKEVKARKARKSKKIVEPVVERVTIKVADLSDEELIAELKARGFRGKLTRTVEFKF